MNSERTRELDELFALYGVPRRITVEIDVSRASRHWWSTDKIRRRDGEVVLFVRRMNGNLLLHTKDFYPGGTMRVPSGGIKQGEPVLETVRREIAEETGLEVVIERFLALVEFELSLTDGIIPYPSYSFLLREVAGILKTSDPDEHISAFGEVPVTALDQVARDLEGVPHEWRDWGMFRAIPHRLVAEILGGAELCSQQAVDPR
jgi:8-oxo-dGTP pyrophosphatase MutT (NUDIX family)